MASPVTPSLARWFAALAEAIRMRFENEEKLVADCELWQRFIEYRWYDPEKGTQDGASEDERIVYDAICFCGMVAADGIECLLSQPEPRLQLMGESMRKLRLDRLVD